jgi:tRNA-modifying protein YgfZ
MSAILHCVLEQRSLVRFDGGDAQAFLHNQLTCDVRGMGADASTYGGYCSPKGRALATFLLWSTPDGYCMQLPRALREPIQKRLSMYILRSRVKAREATADYAQFGVSGPGAGRLVQRILGADPARPHQVVHAGSGTGVHLPGDRYLLVVPAAQASAAGGVLASESQPATEEWWDGLDIAAGIANVGPETQEQFVPQMLNLDAIGAVSFSKGCYPGQEIVARMHYLGRVKERMFRARVAAPHVPRAGEKLYGADLGSQSAGTIVNAVSAGDDTYDVLAVIHLSSVAAGEVRLGAVDGPPLTFMALPYDVPGRGAAST